MHEYTVKLRIDGAVIRLEEVYADTQSEAEEKAVKWARKHFSNLYEGDLYAVAE